MDADRWILPERANYALVRSLEALLANDAYIVITCLMRKYDISHSDILVGPELGKVFLLQSPWQNSWIPKNFGT